MAQRRPPEVVRPIAGLLGTSPERLQEAQARLRERFGPPAAASAPAPFGHTTYYQAEMGGPLLRQFLVFDGLRAPDELPAWKCWTNELETALGLNGCSGRRINIDPGYLAPGKLVLASTKDHEHRVYLAEGIWGEVTLHIRQGRFQTWPWTYPDYAEARPFFEEAYRAYLQALNLRREAGETAAPHFPTED